MEPRPLSAARGIVLPVFAVTRIGYGAGRTGLFGEPACRAATFFMFNFAILVLQLQKPAATAVSATLPWGTLSAFYLAVSRCMRLGMVAGRAIGGRRLDSPTIARRNADFGILIPRILPVRAGRYARRLRKPDRSPCRG